MLKHFKKDQWPIVGNTVNQKLFSKVKLEEGDSKQFIFLSRSYLPSESFFYLLLNVDEEIC
jgi:hypothetical protein